MAEKETWDLSREEIEERARKQNEAKEQKSQTRGGRSYGQGAKLIRIREYLSQNTNKEHTKNATEIKEYLEELGIPASLKTIYNDIATLKSYCDVPIEYSAKKRGYYIAQQEFDLHELRLLVDCVQTATFLTDKEADAITRKVKKLTNIHDRKSLNRKVYALDRPIKPKESIMRNADKIHEAIAQNRQISFRYYEYVPDRNDPIEYVLDSKTKDIHIVSPFALFWYRGEYYLYGITTKIIGVLNPTGRSKGIPISKSTFVVYRASRMLNVRITSTERQGKYLFRELKINSQTAGQFLAHLGPEYTVSICFHNSTAGLVMERFGSGIDFTEYDDTHFRIDVRIPCNADFYAWLTTLGSNAKILGPQEVIAAMKDYIQAVADVYEEEGKL